MPAPIVFFDIAGPDGAQQKAFYSEVFGWSTNAMGNIDGAGLMGALRQDPAAKVLYLGVPDVTAALKQVETSGGKILEFTGRHETVSRGGKGFEAVKRASLVRVLPAAIELINWDDVEGKPTDKNGKGQGGLFD